MVFCVMLNWLKRQDYRSNENLNLKGNRENMPECNWGLDEKFCKPQVEDISSTLEKEN